MPIRTINNVVKYVTTEAQEPITAATSTLKVNETQQLYPVMQGPTSILEIKSQLMKQKLIAHVSRRCARNISSSRKRN